MSESVTHKTIGDIGGSRRSLHQSILAGQALAMINPMMELYHPPFGGMNPLAGLFAPPSPEAIAAEKSQKMIWAAERMEHSWPEDIHTDAMMVPPWVSFGELFTDFRELVKTDILANRIAPTPKWMKGWYDYPYIYPRFGYIPEVYRVLNRCFSHQEVNPTINVVMTLISELAMDPELKPFLEVDRGPVPWSKSSVRKGWEPCLWQGTLEVDGKMLELYVQYDIVLSRAWCTKIDQIKKHSHRWNLLGRHPANILCDEQRLIWLLGGRHAKRVIQS